MYTFSKILFENMNFRTHTFTFLQRASVVGTGDQMGRLDKMMKVAKI